MRRSSLSSPIRPLLLAAMLSSLAACSLQPPRPPPPAPVVIKTAPPTISPQLLVPPEHQAIDRLLKTLGLPPVNVAMPSSASPPSNPNSSRN